MPPIVPINEDNPNDSDADFHASDDEIPNFVLNEDDFDSDTTNNSDDDGDGSDGGYQLLPQEPDGIIQINNNYNQQNIPEDIPENEPPNNPLTPASTYISARFHEALNTPIQEDDDTILTQDRGTLEDIKMDDEQIAKIKETMANIRLPSSAIPGWANSIPEEKWKTDLISKIQERKEK